MSDDDYIIIKKDSEIESDKESDKQVIIKQSIPKNLCNRAYIHMENHKKMRRFKRKEKLDLIKKDQIERNSNEFNSRNYCYTS